MEMEGFGTALAHLEAKGLSKVWAAYADDCPRVDIESIGFNPNSGYVWISLKNGIQICSCLGQDVEFLVTNFDTGEETFHGSYDEAYGPAYK